MPKRRKGKKYKNGHWFIHVPLIALAIGFWLIPFDTLQSEVNEIGAKIGLLSTVTRTVIEELTLTTRSAGTLLVAAISLFYIWWSRKKSS